MDLSIIIVPYKCKDQLDVTLEAVFNSRTKYKYEVIVLDNDSRDGTVEMVRAKYPQAILIENENVGFAKANNKGMAMAKGEYLLLLNPDTKLASDNLEVMMDFMKSHPQVGIATSKLIKGNGELDWACRRMEPNPKTSFYRLTGLQYIFPKKFGNYNVMDKSIDEETEIDACCGAYMMIPRKAYEAVGGFDESFFMYGEDLDLCRRYREAGFKIWYYPKTMSYHYKGQSSKKASQKSLYAFHEAMWIYYKKWYYKKTPSILSGLIYVGIWARYYLKLFINFFKKNPTVSK